MPDLIRWEPNGIGRGWGGYPGSLSAPAFAILDRGDEPYALVSQLPGLRREAGEFLARADDPADLRLAASGLLREFVASLGVAAEDLATLQAMISDLSGYVERRAQEIAEPVMKLCEKGVQQAYAEARGQVERNDDLIAELRRRLASTVQLGERYQALKHAADQVGIAARKFSTSGARLDDTGALLGALVALQEAADA